MENDSPIKEGRYEYAAHLQNTRGFFPIFFSPIEKGTSHVADL